MRWLHFQTLGHTSEDSAVLRSIEIQTLIFPLLIVSVASVSFLWGGHCGAWQWWMSVFVVISLPWCIVDKRSALLSDMCFLLLLFALWLGSSMVTDSASSPDYYLYHLPQMRLLCAGWNPVTDPECTKVLGLLGMSIDGMGYWHVTYCPKTAAVLNAVASFFTCDPYAMTWPSLFLLHVGMTCSLLRVFGMRYFWFVALAAAFIWYIQPETYVDACLLFASAGLLSVMYWCLVEHKMRIVPLVVFSFWMVNLKLPGLVAAFVFWFIFGAAFLFKLQCQRKKTILIFLFIAVAQAILFSVTSFSPYGTSFRDKGHPLYPFMTVNVDKYPVRNLTWDFKIGNSDYGEMGYWGEFFNSYTFPSLVRAYYGMKLGKNDFKPHKYVWDYSFEDTDLTSPMSSASRICLWLAMAALFLVPSFRVFGVMFLVSLFIFPREYMGFERYQVWWKVFECMAVAAVVSLLSLGTLRILACAAAIVTFLILGRGIVSSTHRVLVRYMEQTRSYDKIYAQSFALCIPTGYKNLDGDSCPYGGRIEGRCWNNCRLLMLQTGHEGVEVVDMPACGMDEYEYTPFGYFQKAAGEKRNRGWWKKEGLVGVAKLVATSWCQCYPWLLRNRY